MDGWPCSRKNGPAPPARNSLSNTESTGTINRKASLSGRLKRQTGAPDQRRKPPGGWPDARGKRVRAEPVAALYEQGRVRHAPADGVPLSALEKELMAFGGAMEGAGSLDRADALVWAVTDLLIDAKEGERGPRIRQL